MRKCVCVIGAGAAGLCAARQLSDCSATFEFDVVEQTGRVGGTWIYTDRTGTDENGLPVHSSMYKNMRTNLPLSIMEYPDFPVAGPERDFVHHSDVLAYLEAYADNYRLKQFIQFHRRVTSVKRLDDRWEVRSRCVTDTDSAESTKLYDAVMLCNGRYSRPKYPAVGGLETFTGSVIHSHNYREATPYTGQRVFILGAGPSGVDICLEVATRACQVFLCHQLPQAYVDLADNIEQVRDGIASISGRDIVLQSGRVVDNVDAVILATGYHYDFSFLDANCGIRDNGKGRVVGVYLHLFNTTYPSMAVWAIPQKILPFPIYHQQVTLFIKSLTGQIVLPSKAEMDEDADNYFRDRSERGLPDRHYHLLTRHQMWEYDDRMCQVGHLTPIVSVKRKIFNHLHELRAKNTAGYKETKIIIHNDRDFTVIPPAT